MHDILAKAAETVSTYTVTPATRSIFAPENVERQIKTFVPTDTPLRSRLARTAGAGQAVRWDALTSQLVPGDRGTGALPGTTTTGTGVSAAFADAGTPNETTQTYDTYTAAYKLLGRDVTLGRHAIATSRNWRNMFEERKRAKIFEVMLAEEWYTLNGNAAVDSNEYDGLAKLITTYSGALSLLTVSGINVQMVRPYVQSGARFQHLVCNPFQAKALSDELQATGSIQRIMIDNQGRVTSGASTARLVNSIDGSLIEVIPHRYAYSNAYLLTTKEPNGENALEMQDLEPMSYYDVPFTGHGIQGRVYEDTVLVVRYEVHQMKLTGNAIS